MWGYGGVRPCTFEGTPTTCAIDVTRLRLSGDGQRVVAIGTVTPRGVPDAPSVPVPGAGAPRRRPFAGGGRGRSTLQGALSCDILRLVLGPLHLDVLGLVIDLNRVVLTIVGETGAGNLLGNLLSALTGLLDGGVPLTRFLGVLTNLLAAINTLLRL